MQGFRPCCCGGAEPCVDDRRLGQRQQEVAAHLRRQACSGAGQKLEIGGIVRQSESRNGVRKLAEEVDDIGRGGEPGRILARQSCETRRIAGLGDERDFSPEGGLLDQAARSDETRPIEKEDRRLRIAFAVQHREGEGDRAGDPEVEGVEIELAQELERIGPVVGDVRDGAAREPAL